MGDRRTRLGLLEQASSCRGTDAPRSEAPVEDRSQVRPAPASTPPGGEGDGEAPFHLGPWWVVPEKALGSNLGASRQWGETGSRMSPLAAPMPLRSYGGDNPVSHAWGKRFPGWPTLANLRSNGGPFSVACDRRLSGEVGAAGERGRWSSRRHCRTGGSGS